MNIIDDATVENTSLLIQKTGQVQRFEYDEIKSFHEGDSWFGCTVGFRAMQLAARELSDDDSMHNIWSREQLSIVSGHPGPGVRDAIELVTGTVSSGRYQLLDSIDGNGCNSSMRFEWWITLNDRALHIKLKDDVVPDAFFILLDTIVNAREKGIEPVKEDRKVFDQMKQELSNKLWSQSLDTSFNFDDSHSPLTTKK